MPTIVIIIIFIGSIISFITGLLLVYNGIFTLKTQYSKEKMYRSASWRELDSLFRRKKILNSKNNKFTDKEPLVELKKKDALLYGGIKVILGVTFIITAVLLTTLLNQNFK